jgi:hypothetical protein
MARKDWINVGVSSLLVDAIDSFLKSDGAKITKMNSRQQFVNTLILEYFASYKQRTGIAHIKPPVEEEKIPSLLDLGTKKTKK